MLVPNKKQLFDEVSGNSGIIDRTCFNTFLQANGVCFPAYLTEAFFRRFNFEKEDVLYFEQFNHALQEMVPNR